MRAIDACRIRVSHRAIAFRNRDVSPRKTAPAGKTTSVNRALWIEGAIRNGKETTGGEAGLQETVPEEERRQEVDREEVDPRQAVAEAQGRQEEAGHEAGSPGDAGTANVSLGLTARPTPTLASRLIFSNEQPAGGCGKGAASRFAFFVAQRCAESFSNSHSFTRTALLCLSITPIPTVLTRPPRRAASRS
jgi:hypothetical protein